jgi:iron complex transport system permease protein
LNVTPVVDLRKGAPLFFGICLSLLLALFLAGISLGPVRVPLTDVLRALLSALPGAEGAYDGPDGWRTIVLRIRLPAVVMAIAVGAALSSAGSSLQGLFRNDLVDPFIIGISAGGALGWVVGSILGPGPGWAGETLPRMALCFLLSMGAVLAAYAIARRGPEVPVPNLLLAGIAISAMLTSTAQALIYLFVDNPAETIFSLMGGLGGTRWSEVALVVPVSALGVLVLALLGKELNAFGAGEEGARHMGVPLERSKVAIIGAASLLTAVTIPFCGIIGFVGLIVPHIARRFVGPDQRVLIPASALLGAGFLVACDLVARSATGIVIPLGIVTGALGGAFFIYLLASRRLSR